MFTYEFQQTIHTWIRVEVFGIKLVIDLSRLIDLGFRVEVFGIKLVIDLSRLIDE